MADEVGTLAHELKLLATALKEQVADGGADQILEVLSEYLRPAAPDEPGPAVQHIDIA